MKIKILASLCLMAYKGLEFYHSKFIGNSQHKFVIETSNKYIIIFRGSVNLQDWLDDLDIYTSYFYDKNVKIGFLNSLEEDQNRQLKYDKPVIVTGHSLGGAVSILHAFELAMNGTIIDKVVTFGSPRVGTRAFQEYYDTLLKDNTFRYVNGSDVVPRIPPTTFCHVGIQIQIGEKYKWNNPIGWAHLFLDHKIRNYINTINF